MVFRRALIPRPAVLPLMVVFSGRRENVKRSEELGLSPAGISLPSGAMDSPEEFEDLLETLQPSAADDSDEMPRLFHQATIAREKKEEITRLAQSAAVKARELADIKLKAIEALDNNLFENIDDILKEARPPMEAMLGLVNQVIGLVWADLFFIARKFVDTDAEAKDVAQRAAEKIYKHIHTFNANASAFRTWYYEVTKNTAADSRRGQTRWSDRLFKFLKGNVEDEAAPESESVRLVDAMLSKMSQDCRTRLGYLYPRGTKVGGMKEIAEDLEEDYEASKKRTQKCIEIAKRHFESLSKGKLADGAT